MQEKVSKTVDKPSVVVFFILDKLESTCWLGSQFLT